MTGLRPSAAELINIKNKIIKFAKKVYKSWEKKKKKEGGRRNVREDGVAPRGLRLCAGCCAVLNAGTQLCRSCQRCHGPALQAAAGEFSRNQSYGESPPPAFQALSSLLPIGLPGRSGQEVLEWWLADPYPTISGTVGVGKWGLRTEG